MKTTAILLAAALSAGPALAQPKDGAELAIAVAMVEWTAEHCPAGTVPPQAFMLAGLATAFGAEPFISKAREEFPAHFEKTGKTTEEHCAFFGQVIGKMVGDAARVLSAD